MTKYTVNALRARNKGIPHLLHSSHRMVSSAESKKESAESPTRQQPFNNRSLQRFYAVPLMTRTVCLVYVKYGERLEPLTYRCV